MTNLSLSDLLNVARGANFAAAGVARLPLAAQYAAQFEQWVARGNHADMQWLARDAPGRFSGEAALSGAQSVVVLAANNHPYLHGEAPPPSQPQAGDMRIADFALGDDYHFVLREATATVVRWLDNAVHGHAWRVCVDSAPFAERTAALAAGIGTVGRNAMVMVADPQTGKNLGSHFLFVCIVTTAILEETAPNARLENPCGECHLCIDVCPGGALSNNGFDARRCVSWLTIEKREPLTAAEHRTAGHRLFGCDDCRTICPHNVGATQTSFTRLRSGVRTPPIIPDTAFQQMTRREFKEKFAGSPLWRTGLRRLRERGQQ